MDSLKDYKYTCQQPSAVLNNLEYWVVFQGFDTIVHDEIQNGGFKIAHLSTVPLSHWNKEGGLHMASPRAFVQNTQIEI
jgi:hypothetical protein